MIKFEYLEPASVKEAVGLLSKYGDEAKAKASGVSLLLLLKDGFYQPKYLVNLLKIAGLDYIKKDSAGNLLIGALTRHSDLESSPLIQKEFPVLAEMEYDLGSVQLRNRGTIGGCVCHGDPLTDPPPVFVALDASAKVQGPAGSRKIPFSQFFLDYYQTSLASDEILTEIIVPKLAPHTGLSYIKHTMRKAMDKPFVGVCASLTLDSSSVCKKAKVIIGAISPGPLEATSIEEALIGKKVTDSLIDDVTTGYELGDMDFTFDIRCPADYKRWTTPVIIKRALKLALSRVS
jgi:aerobic carbon-monoxide dehydrogenase medium subunit